MRFSLLLFALAAAVQAQESPTYVSEFCDLSVLGASEKESFLQFDRDLRHALENNDRVALSLLISYSVRVNVGFGASALLNEAAIFGDRYDEILSPGLRSKVLAQGPEQTRCNWNGISYGNGSLWVNPDDHGYAIWVINPGSRPSDKPSEIVFTCRTDQRRAVVTHVDDEQGFRYRSWPSAESLTAEPAVDLTAGARRREGTGSCGHWIWSFDAPDGAIEISEVGCTREGDNARGRLSIQSEGGKALVEDCI